ncbi:hypothetical protein SteCoe_22496 [Stentor coeruleus]|uniref:Uncharacterized protein n=1 Tax=Stentor coeruleus TaxID=5963 RepID=A0A1R2BLX6_9CILI|nr:hypothetical protein SteCoe_22496 [Stentor coeruleus]
MSEELRLRYGIEFDQSKPRDFSVNDLDGLARSPYSKDTPTATDGNSRALAGAMKALQDKIKFLESELIQYKEQLATVETKNLNDREKWQTRLLDEISMSKERDSLIQQRFYETEEELKKALSRISTLDEQVKIKDLQCKFAENESKRNMEQFSVEMEGMIMQNEHLQKTLQAKIAGENKIQKAMEQAIRDKNLSEEELKQQKRINSGLQAEVSYLRENAEHQRSSLQKNKQNIENELTTLNAELTQRVKELEVKNKSLRDQNYNQSQQINHLKKEIAEMTKINDSSNTVKFENIKSKTLPKKPPSKSSSKTPRRSPRRSMSPGVKKTTESHKVVKPHFDNENEFKKRISFCEREIDKLSTSYRDLINLSSTGSGNLGELRKEMARIADDIEKKNEELYEYKKKQQDFLRARLMI